ncbi:MAG: D-amino-acid transaminase [Gammaproteobacteria bacterium]|nr:D-amino-acid transaminase [Gammaproteobacteria bacterium]
MNPADRIVYLNGEFLPQSKAMVPALDRGFVFGDGVYEVIPVYGGRLFRLNEHLARLQNSLDGIRIPNPLTITEWTHLLQTLVERNNGGNLSVYFQVTRGVAPRDHAFPANTPATIYAMANPLSPVPQNILENGISTITVEDIRWRYCHIKAITLLPNVLLRQQAIDAGAQEAILVRDGVVTEGAASNLFIVKDNVVKTPPKGPFLLPGITRDLILELAAANNIEHAECPLTTHDLASADEVWMTSSTKEILPVTRVDDLQVGNGRPGPMWARMLALYQDYKNEVAAGRAH